MEIKEFIEKADEVKEINIFDEFKNGMIYRVYAQSQHENVKNHAQSIIDKVIPTIEDCYHIRYEGNLYVVNKEVVDNVVQTIETATDKEIEYVLICNTQNMLKSIEEYGFKAPYTTALLQFDENGKPEITGTFKNKLCIDA